MEKAIEQLDKTAKCLQEAAARIKKASKLVKKGKLDAQTAYVFALDGQQVANDAKHFAISIENECPSSPRNGFWAWLLGKASKNVQK